MANISLATIAGYWKNVSDWVTGIATPPKVRISGRTVKGVLLTSSTSVAAAGNEIISVVVPGGKKWTVKHAGFQVNGVPIATSGVHAMHVAVQDSGSGSAAELSRLVQDYSLRLQYTDSQFWNGQVGAYYTAGFVIPDNREAQSQLFKGIEISGNVTMTFNYFNNSNAAQTNTRTVSLIVIEEDV